MKIKNIVTICATSITYSVKCGKNNDSRFVLEKYNILKTLSVCLKIITTSKIITKLLLVPQRVN